MEINLIPVGTNPMGALAMQDIVEGRCVILAKHTQSADFGSLSDLPGARLPVNDTEAQMARYIVTWTAPDRRVDGANVWIVDAPSVSFALRHGFGSAANLPMNDVDVRITWPGNQESQTIPSGMKLLYLHDGAVVTIPSGQYVWNANLANPGSRLEVLNSGDDGAGSAGKMSYAAAGAIAEVVEFNSSTAALTVRMLG
jgi:hypothetical protein